MEPVTLYQQIAADIRRQIKAGRLGPGEQVGPIGVLKEHHGVAVGTVRDALKVLGDEGLVVTIPGKGTFVRDAEALAAAPGASAELAELRHRVEEISEQAAVGGPGPLLERLGRIEANLMDLYGKLGYEYPRERPAAQQARSRKASGG